MKFKPSVRIPKSVFGRYLAKKIINIKAKNLDETIEIVTQIPEFLKNDLSKDILIFEFRYKFLQIALQWFLSKNKI